MQFVIDEAAKVERQRERAAERNQTKLKIDQSLSDTMVFEDSNTQATQPYTDPRRLGLHGSGISEDDAANVICILHPSSPAAYHAVAATVEQNANHIIPNSDLLAGDDESLFDPDARIEQPSREIALRLSSEVKYPESGFVFGRNPDKCDILMTNNCNDTAVSNRHFRIYVAKSGVLMLQDTSTNGTLLDETHLVCKQTNGSDDSTRMLQNGTMICILGNERKEIKFLVRVPNRGDHQEAYNANLAKYVHGLPGAKTNLVLSACEFTFGMHWNGGSEYNVIGCLGKGAFATVYKLATKRDGLVYAAKELDKRRFLKNGILDMKFDNEIQIMKNLRHPNIVQYQDYHDHEDWAYIIMEIVTGGELSEYMRKHGPVPEPTVQNITHQMLHALAYLHARGITHRDIKPDNILISQTDPLQVKLSDFGLSKCITNQETFLKTFCGTLLYCAPEIYPGYDYYDKTETKKRRRLGDRSPKRYNERVDMWSFGAVLYHLLCNHAPVTTDGEDKAATMLINIMTKDINFDPLYAVGVSEEAADFVSSLLKRNPILRPTPKACFEHAWISEVADAIDKMDLDDEMPAYPGQGLATVEEADEHALTRSPDTSDDHLFGAVSFGYLTTAGERISKRQRITPRAKAKDGVTTQPSCEVVYPMLPQTSDPGGAIATGPRNERLFGEITSSALRSSGVFAAAQSPAIMPALQHGVEQISVNDFVTFETNEPSRSTGESSGQPLQYPRALGIPGAEPSSAPSLLGAEAQINQLNMASPGAGNSEATTPDIGNPMTPETRELTPVANQQENIKEATARHEPVSNVQEEPAFSRYIDLQLPEHLQHDTQYVKKFNAEQAENKARRARLAKITEAKAKAEAEAKAKAKTFSGSGQTKEKVVELAKTTDGRNGMEIDSGGGSTRKFSRRIDLPPLESLYPQSTITPDGFIKPLRRFGKLTTLPGSFIDLTIYINSRMTSWGRGSGCNVPYGDKGDVRIPQYAIMITYFAPGIEARIEEGKDWENAPDIHTVVSTGASANIWVNDIELRKESSEERCAYYGKIYTGDIITVFQTVDPKGPFLKFRVEMYYGDSARRRPENEKGFQVLKETVFYEQEMKRRQSREGQ